MIRNRSAAYGWWRDLTPRDGHAGDRAASARLRRAATVAEAMTEVATITLFRRLGASAAADLPRVALTAAVLAHVRQEPEAKTVARLLGPEKIDDPATAMLSPLRFKRLIEAEGEDEQLIAFRRMAAIARGSLPVSDLADSLLDWNERQRRRWVYDYWNAGQPNPSPKTTAPEEAAAS